jgi:DNA repair protein RecO (recombination protein O)
MNWSEPAVVLSVRPLGDADLIALVMTGQHGSHSGLVRGGTSREKIGTWQVGNLLQVQWTGRLADQLGGFTGELVYATAALAMQDPLSLAMLNAACATADGVLQEREPYPRIFAGLVELVPRIATGESALPALIRWEMTVLADLGYGLDLSACAVTGQTDGLAYVSPRTGRAVTPEGAGVWQSRLLPLPAFLRGTTEASIADIRDGLRLTGHFLARDAFGSRHLPLPQPRLALYDLIDKLAAGDDQHAG